MNKLITIYFFNKKQDSILILLSIISITLVLLRIKITHSFYLLFMVWNLLLAILPYALSYLIDKEYALKFEISKNTILLLIWFLFLPNSFYLITDFVHLNHRSILQFSYDFILLSLYTILGFYTGIKSIYRIYKIVFVQFSHKIANGYLVATCYLSAYGIYLGRILRFNSWDVINNPLELLTSLIESLLKLEALLFTLILGTIILLSFIVSKPHLSKNQ
ncbi:DUF1361 domain-containing protein [Flavobacterium sp. SUN052]|uniref:DUF1361 domain-containing protein n=1 Tax=Flavobacterium sp. SUN052 TaxID=3002441 RepID=UPI00237E40E6|nr:DUF1361 domain-containing protein [Flavobacterium sp. SUN052]MEC4004813.1 DUF1361 domain-containing protein [Flavobacterium sp. SUN052]